TYTICATDWLYFIQNEPFTIHISAVIYYLHKLFFIPNSSFFILNCIPVSNQKVIFSMTGVVKVHKPNNRVLNDIYLSFFYGAKIGVLGNNGSGKVRCCALLPVRMRITWEKYPAKKVSASVCYHKNLSWIPKKPLKRWLKRAFRKPSTC